MGKFNVFDCSVIELDRHHSARKGNLSVVENGVTLPFDVKRVYYTYDVPGGGKSWRICTQTVGATDCGSQRFIYRVP